ncbi:hypothetical protein [Brachybacterium sp. UNK5269]|uniref:hypothetical protein n=1 Tax=Brachybacterium sp. UNK5269 TaxID=3408576 RepID=UPI003BB15901
MALEGPEPVTATITVPYQRLALFAPDREGWELPDGPLTVRVARSSADTVGAQEITIPRAHRERHPLPAAGGDLVPADRAEETAGLARSATTLLEGTELRPLALTAAGTADFVLAAGTVITALETRELDLGALAPAPGSAELIDAEAADPSAAALPLPHRVPATGARPTGRVRVRLTGPLALTGLRAEHP